MTLREFIHMVGTTNDCYTMVGIRRKSGKGFNGRTGDTWTDSVLGFSFCKREEYGDDWGLGKVPVIGIETIETRYGTTVCAVIE